MNDNKQACLPRKKVRHRGIPDTYWAHLIAQNVFTTEIDGRALGVQASFTCKDLYKIVLSHGSHVLVSPAPDAAIDIDALVAMNYRGIGVHPVFVVTRRRTKAAIKDRIEALDMTAASDFSGSEKDPVIVDETDIRALKKYLDDQRGRSDSMLLFDYGIPKTDVEFLVGRDLTAVRTVVIMSNDHVSEIIWHKQMNFPHKAYFVNCAKMLSTNNTYLTSVSKCTVAHRGSRSDIESSLRWIWKSKIQICVY